MGGAGNLPKVGLLLLYRLSSLLREKNPACRRCWNQKGSESPMERPQLNGKQKALHFASSNQGHGNLAFVMERGFLSEVSPVTQLVLWAYVQPSQTRVPHHESRQKNENEPESEANKSSGTKSGMRATYLHQVCQIQVLTLLHRDRAKRHS